MDFRRAVSIELRDVDRHTRWNGTGLDERDYLTAVGVTENLEVLDHASDERRAIGTLDVWIERVPVPEVEALLRVVLDRNAHPLPDWRVEMYVRVPGPMYRDLVAAAAGGVGRIAVTSRVQTQGGAIGVAEGAHAVKVPLEDVGITAERPLAMQGPAAMPEPAAPPGEAELVTVLEHAVPGGRSQSPQLWQIGLELVRSAAAATVTAARPDAAVARATGDDVGRLIVAVREAFRPVLVDPSLAPGPSAPSHLQDPLPIALGTPAGDALDDTGGAPPVLADRVDPLWSHVAAAPGKGASSAVLAPPPLARLESVAGRYCATDALASPTLEWAIVDALVHDATQRVPGPPASRASTLLAGLRRLWPSAVRARGVAGREDRQRIADDLRAAYDRVRDAAFNAGQLRSLLYALEARGVSINPWVYHVLDKRIRRGGEVP